MKKSGKMSTQLKVKTPARPAGKNAERKLGNLPKPLTEEQIDRRLKDSFPASDPLGTY